MAWPQAALLFFVACAAIAIGSAGNPDAARALSGILPPANFLFVGPYSVGFAIRKEYSGFRLLAYGQRYV
jgi:hypothetical protein